MTCYTSALSCYRRYCVLGYNLNFASTYTPTIIPGNIQGFHFGVAFHAKHSSQQQQTKPQKIQQNEMFSENVLLEAIKAKLPCE